MRGQKHRHGMGHPDIRKWDPERGGGAGYGLKGSARYGLKAEEVLELNGGRFGTWSGGFFGMPYKQALSEAVHAYLLRRVVLGLGDRRCFTQRVSFPRFRTR
jgi:hypothetical protein